MHKSNGFLTSSKLAMVSAAAVVMASALAAPASADESAKWFVVRHHTTGDCWTAKLVRVDGEFVHAFAQTAGGPYDTKKEARAREDELVRKGVCVE